MLITNFLLELRFKIAGDMTLFRPFILFLVMEKGRAKEKRTFELSKYYKCTLGSVVHNTVNT